MDDRTRMAISQRLKEARKGRGLTQLDVANALGIAAGSVSGWERGVSIPDSGHYLMLSDILGVTVSWLYGQDDEPTDFSKEEVRLVRLYRGSTEVGQRDIMAVAMDAYYEATKT